MNKSKEKLSRLEILKSLVENMTPEEIKYYKKILKKKLSKLSISCDPS
jgi:hypothetical protein